mmetsp:Transcript_62523/g.149030  ORF Transcript_62523/g.149030 Transcript_62523/m.149030 type:complete len:224 (-) Transcript_62523:157-828(-)
MCFRRPVLPTRSRSRPRSGKCSIVRSPGRPPVAHESERPGHRRGHAQHRSAGQEPVGRRARALKLPRMEGSHEADRSARSWSLRSWTTSSSGRALLRTFCHLGFPRAVLPWRTFARFTCRGRSRGHSQVQKCRGSLRLFGWKIYEMPRLLPSLLRRSARLSTAHPMSRSSAGPGGIRTSRTRKSGPTPASPISFSRCGDRQIWSRTGSGSCRRRPRYPLVPPG